MSSIIDQFSELISQTKRLMKKMKKKKNTSYKEILELEQALSKQSDAAGNTTSFFTVSEAWKFRLVGISVVFLGYFIFQSLEILYLILAGFILSMALENVVARLQRWFSRGFSIMTAYVLLLVFLLSGLIIVVPFVVQQMADIVNVLLGKVNVIQDTLQSDGLIAVIETSGLPSQMRESLLAMVENGNWMESVQASLAENISQIISVGSNYISNAGALAVSIVASFFSAFIQVSIVFIVAVFFTLEKDKVVHFLAHTSGNFAYTELKLKKLYMKLGFWLKGQLFLSLIIALAVGLGLIILGWIGIDISNKFTLSLIAGLTEFIPYVGPFMGMFPALLLGGLSHGWSGLIAVAILYWIIQQSENNILIPMIMSQTLGVSPLLIFLSMVIGGSLFGLLGIILAVPFAVIVNILFEDYKNSVQPPLKEKHFKK